MSSFSSSETYVHPELGNQAFGQSPTGQAYIHPSLAQRRAIARARSFTRAEEVTRPNPPRSASFTSSRHQALSGDGRKVTFGGSSSVLVSNGAQSRQVLDELEPCRECAPPSAVPPCAVDPTCKGCFSVLPDQAASPAFDGFSTFRVDLILPLLIAVARAPAPLSLGAAYTAEVRAESSSKVPHPPQYILACGYLNEQAGVTTGEAITIVAGLHETFDSMLDAVVARASPAALALGIVAGSTTGREALDIYRRAISDRRSSSSP